MVETLKSMLNKRLISYDGNFIFKKLDESLYSIMLNFEDTTVELYADIKYFTLLGDTEDYYSFFEVRTKEDENFDSQKLKEQMQTILVNQSVNDIKIVTDYYHCFNEEEGWDDTFVQDSAIIFEMEKEKLCFQISIWDEIIYPSKQKNDEEVSLFDINENFNGESMEEGAKFFFHTERKREIHSVNEIVR